MQVYRIDAIWLASAEIVMKSHLFTKAATYFLYVIVVMQGLVLFDFGFTLMKWFSLHRTLDKYPLWQKDEDNVAGPAWNNITDSMLVMDVEHDHWTWESREIKVNYIDYQTDRQLRRSEYQDRYYDA